MFVGTFEHALDGKGRVVLPASFRARLEHGGYVTKRLDGCLAVWTPDEFEREAQEMLEKERRGEIARNVVRSFSAGAAPIRPDAQGRIALPQNLREFAGLERDVAVIGHFTSIEIWDASRWREVDQEGEALLAGGAPAV
ncbi:MAG: division/cell wall cluster transcriptional repressor MraZ [Acidimicrobiales bacterium]|nr:division/cell wall cluster transcriptional repressor MraZ [Acidimicrobiales bacterium]